MTADKGTHMHRTSQFFTDMQNNLLLLPGRQWNGEDFLAILLFQSWVKNLSVIVNYHR